MDRRDMLKSAVGLASSAMIEPRIPQSRVSPGRRGRAPYIETRDGQQLFYKDWGTGDPMVFLAGWALPSDMWDYQMAPLSGQGLRCVAYDRRGHGRSSLPCDGYDYDTLADDLAAVLDALDLQNATLVAMSMASGEIVRYLTRHASRRIARLVLLSTAAPPSRMQTADNPTGIPAGGAESFQRRSLLRYFPNWIEENRQPF